MQSQTFLGTYMIFAYLSLGALLFAAVYAAVLTAKIYRHYRS